MSTSCAGDSSDSANEAIIDRFEAAGRREGVLFIGRAQEKVPLFRTRKRRRADGSKSAIAKKDSASDGHEKQLQASGY